MRHWLWVFATPQTTVYAIRSGPGFDDAATVLGIDFAGVLVRDGWAPYRRFTHALHQTFSHHQREEVLMADPSRVRISGVLQSFAVGFAAELARQGYTPRSLQTQLYLMAHVSRWLHAKDLDVADFPAQTQPFLQARQGAGYKRHLTGKALRPLLTYLRDHGAVPPAPPPIAAGPLDEALTRYRRYLTVERGLGEATARGYVDAVRPFLCRCVSGCGRTPGAPRRTCTPTRTWRPCWPPRRDCAPRIGWQLTGP